jgi:outer membrane protein TolC
VVTAAIQEASLRGQIAATLKLIKDEREQVVIVRDDFDLVGASEADVLTQQIALAQTEATLPPLRKQLQIERDLLRMLTGHFPDQDVGENSIFQLDLPQNLLLTLPSQLVEQRPDVPRVRIAPASGERRDRRGHGEHVAAVYDKRRSWHLCGNRDESWSTSI